MAEYLFSRTDIEPPAVEPSLLEGQMFFSLWKVRADPYNRLADGDTMWWVSPDERVIRWELRVKNLLKRQVADHDEALRVLRQGFGVFPEDLTNPYADAGREWLHAWNAEVMARVEVPLPAGVKLGRTGYRAIDDELRRMLDASGLPAPSGGEPMVPVDRVDMSLLGTPLADRPRRFIPLATVREVRERDANRCQSCGASPPDVTLHIDHIWPWSKGGTNDPDNLQLLCATCNLKKGARIEGGGLAAPASGSMLASLAAGLGCGAPTDEGDVPRLLTDAVLAGRAEEAIATALDLLRHPETTDELKQSVLDALEVARPAWSDRIDAFRATFDPRLSLESAAELAGALGGSNDPWARAQARLVAVSASEEASEHPAELLASADLVLSIGDELQRARAHLLRALALDVRGETTSDERRTSLREALKTPELDTRALAALDLAELDAVIAEEADDPIGLLDARERLSLAFAAADPSIVVDALLLRCRMSLSYADFDDEYVPTSSLPYLEQAEALADDDAAMEVRQVRQDLETCIAERSA